MGRVPSRLIAWLAERCVEIPLAALLVLVVLADGRPLSGDLLAHEWRFAIILLSAFHVMTGYVFSTLFLSVLARAPTIGFQLVLMVGAFIVHFGILALLSPSKSELAPFLPGGMIIVALATLSGCAVLRLISSEHTQIVTEQRS